jgi:hypothetical protein
MPTPRVASNRVPISVLRLPRRFALLAFRIARFRARRSTRVTACHPPRAQPLVGLGPSSGQPVTGYL